MITSKLLIRSLIALPVALLNLSSYGMAPAVAVLSSRDIAGTSGPAGAGEAIRPAGATSPTARALIDRYNSRELGAPAWRRVVLSLVNGSQVSRSFTVINLWHDTKERTRTLFLLEAPSGLKGTNYLLVEDKARSNDSDMKIFLQLPAGQRTPLEIKSRSFGEGLLGSDFAYNDLRMRMPARGVNYRLLGQAKMLGAAVWAIEAVSSSAESARNNGWHSARFYLAQEFPLIMGADYFAGADQEAALPFKRMRVEGFEKVEGIWTATRITMSASDARASILELKDIRHRVAAQKEELFSPAHLPELAEKARRGWSPESRPSL
jgi:hypothetical protein